jgi:hypothetical protein
VRASRAPVLSGSHRIQPDSIGDTLALGSQKWLYDADADGWAAYL